MNDTIDLDDELMQQQLTILNIDNELHSVLDNMVKKFNISGSAAYVLYLVTVMPESMTQAALCKMWSYSRQTVNTVLKKMEKCGQVRLVPQEGNRKNKLILLTDEGQAMADRIVSAMITAQKAALTHLTFSEREEYILLLRKYTDASKAEFDKIVL